MYLLVLLQSSKQTELALFENISEARDFAKKIPGYVLEENDGFSYEFFNPRKLPDYMEIEFNGHVIPLTRFMFLDDENVDIIFQQIPNLSSVGKGLVDGQTLVDAYVVENNELENYIKKREKNYETIKQYLEKKGYMVNRFYFGSQDGEAVVYKKNEHDEWNFLTHMDPSFVEDDDIIKSSLEYL